MIYRAWSFLFPTLQISEKVLGLTIKDKLKQLLTLFKVHKYYISINPLNSCPNAHYVTLSCLLLLNSACLTHNKQIPISSRLFVEFILINLWFCKLFFLDLCFSFFFPPFFDLRLLIASLVCSDCSHSLWFFPIVDETQDLPHSKSVF